MEKIFDRLGIPKTIQMNVQNLPIIVLFNYWINTR
jgi:hypothetical protein